MRDILALRKEPANAAEPPRYARRRTALLFSYDNWLDIENHKQTSHWDTTEHGWKYYRALKSFAAPVDVIGGEREFSRYPFVVAPAYQMLDAELVKRFRSYVESGGHLVLSCRSGQKDRDGHLWEGPWAAPVAELIGSAIPLV